MEQPANIKFCFKLGKTATEAQRDLETVYKNEALSHTHIFISQNTVMHITAVNLNEATSCYLM
jgi:hypothetical protein